MNKRGVKSLILLILVFFIPFSVLAKEKELILDVDKTDLEAGDEVVITAELSSDTDLYALTATLRYDEAVFEEINDQSFDVDDNWSNIHYSVENNKFGLINKSGEVSGKLLSFSLRVKDNASVGKTLISLTDITTSNGVDTFEVDDSSVEVLVTRDAKGSETIPEKKEDMIREDEKEVIKTFTLTPIIIGVSIIIGLLLLACIIVNVKKLENREKYNIILVILLTIAIIIQISLCVFNQNKKDVDKDGNTDYEDAEEIIEYIIDLQGEKEAKEQDSNLNDQFNNRANNNIYNRYSASKYDLNNDGRVDVSDIGSVVKDTTKRDYLVYLKEISRNTYYVAKGKNVNIEFAAHVSPNAIIKKIVVDGKVYPVIKNGSNYNVVVKAPNKAGVHEFKFTKVILDNKREVKTNFSMRFEVMKKEPVLNSFEIVSDKNTSKDEITFKIDDPDKAFISGIINVYDETDEIVLTAEVKSGKNSFPFKFRRDKKYTVMVVGSYDLDTNALNSITGSKNEHRDKLFIDKEIMISSVYDFKLSNVAITDIIEKGQAPTITFESTNSTPYKIENVIINGQEYPVTIQEDGKHYTVDLLQQDIPGDYVINIEKIVLETGISFINGIDFDADDLEYVVLKSAPVVNIISLEDDEDNKTLKAKIEVDDKDGVIEKLVAKFTDTNNKVFATKDVVNNEIEFSYDGIDRMKYRVIIYADYDLGAKDYNYVEKEMAKQEISVTPNIYIKESSLTKIYPEKNEIMYVKYTIVVPTDLGKRVGNMITGVTINGLNYSAKRIEAKEETAKYEISFKAPSKAGVHELEANKVMFLDGSTYPVAEKISKIDVLRDKPWIENFKVEEENYDTQTVKFSFDILEDVEGEYKSGQLVLLNSENKAIKTENIEAGSVGHKEVEVSGITKDELLTVVIKANYDRDTSTLDDDPNKNYYLNEEIFATSYGLYDSANYENAKITNLTAISKSNNIYFEKNEKINLKFNFTGLAEGMNFGLSKIVVDGKTYEVIKEEDSYRAIIDGYDEAGVKDIKITNIVLTSGKKLSLTSSNNINVDILKDAVTMNNFKYDISSQDSINIEVDKIDADKALIGDIRVKIFNEDNEQIGSDYTYSGDAISFARQPGLMRYYIRAYANYDRDSVVDNTNRYNDVQVLNEVISFAENRIEMKDITDIVLYRDGEIVNKAKKSEIEANKEAYFVKITMSKMPDMYFDIRRVEISEDNHLILVLEYDGQVSENGKAVDELKVDFGKIDGDDAINDSRPTTFESFIEDIKANPSATHVLDHDLDATGYTVDDSWIIEDDFTGTIEGNGHVIKNLNVTLFKKTVNATIKDLTFKNVKLKSGSHGIIADTSSNTVISGILVNSFEKRSSGGNNDNQTGALVGRAENRTTISQSRVIELQMYNGGYNQVIGGLVGRLNNSTVSNCYVSGIIDAGWHFMGGIVGYSENNAKIENCYSKITMSVSFDDNNNGGITGTSGAVLINNVSLSTSNYGYAIAPGNLGGSSNNYQMDETKYKKNEGEAFTTIKQEDMDAKFFKDRVQLDEEIWNLSEASYTNPPKLNIEEEKIPNNDRIEKDDKYDVNKKLLYKNLYLLMPFYNSEKVVENGAVIDEDNILNKQEIAHIIPLDKDGGLVTYLTKNDYRKINKIKIIFKNEQVEEYDVSFDKLNGTVVGYRIGKLKIDYTFNHYMIDENSTLVNNLVEYLSKLDYSDLDAMTTMEDSRLYRDHYNAVTKNELKEFVLKYLSNSNDATSTEGEIAKHIENDLKANNKLKKALYVYNYFRRWYSVDINGIMLNDLILFNSEGFNELLTPDDIINNFFSYEENFNTEHINNTYNRVFKPYTKINDVTGFIEYFVKLLSNQTPDEWFAKTFKGFLVEIKIENAPEVTYTAWSHIRGTWQNYALVILTLPKDSAYIISSPTQYLIGSARTYVAKPNTEQGQADLMKMLQEYSEKIETYYTTAYSIIGEAQYFNAIHNVQLDHRFTKDENGVSCYQSKYVTEEDYHKNFSEPLNQFTDDNGTAAGANGSQVKYVAYSALTAYGTWSHESAHNQDARLFLLNNGRRWDAGGEDYADGNLSQRWSSGEISMNISIEHDYNTYKNSISTNLSPSRIDSPSKIQDFYSKVFDTYYILDYLEAQAFVQLTPEEQSVLAFKITYRDINNSDESLRQKTTQYTRIGVDEYQKMNLMGNGLRMGAVEKLYDSMVTVYPGMPKTGNYYGSNKYGAEKLQKTRWYAPYNDNGRPDSYSLKLFAYEMLGYKGYVNGYVEYYSNIHADSNGKKTDLMALRRITGNDSITFRDYRLNRFRQAEAKLPYVKYIDANTFVNKMYQAFKEDAADIIAAEAAGKSAPNLPKSSQVKMDAYYELKNGTNDFLDSIYSNSKLREIGSFSQK